MLRSYQVLCLVRPSSSSSADGVFRCPTASAAVAQSCNATSELLLLGKRVTNVVRHGLQLIKLYANHLLTIKMNFFMLHKSHRPSRFIEHNHLSDELMGDGPPKGDGGNLSKIEMAVNVNEFLCLVGSE